MFALVVFSHQRPRIGEDKRNKEMLDKRTKMKQVRLESKFYSSLIIFGALIKTPLPVHMWACVRFCAMFRSSVCQLSLHCHPFRYYSIAVYWKDRVFPLCGHILCACTCVYVWVHMPVSMDVGQWGRWMFSILSLSLNPGLDWHPANPTFSCPLYFHQ